MSSTSMLYSISRTLAGSAGGGVTGFSSSSSVGSGIGKARDAQDFPAGLSYAGRGHGNLNGGGHPR